MREIARWVAEVAEVGVAEVGRVASWEVERVAEVDRVELGRVASWEVGRLAGCVADVDRVEVVLEEVLRDHGVVLDHSSPAPTHLVVPAEKRTNTGKKKGATFARHTFIRLRI